MKKKYKILCCFITIINITFLFLCLYNFMFQYKNINNKIMYNENILLNLKKDYISLENRINNMKNELNFLKDEITNIHNNINDVKIIKNNYVNDIALINAKIDNIINSRPEEEKIKYTIIKVLNTILKKYYNIESFNEELNSLKILCKNNEKLTFEIEKLNKYKDINIDSVMISFENEVKNLVFDKKNIILKDLINIKKISDKSMIKSINNNINDIKINISTNEFKNAMNIINKYNYQDKLKNTYNLLTLNIEFTDLIQSIIDII